MSENGDEGVPLVKPKMSEDRACQVLHQLYGLDVKEVNSMISYDDLNFHFTVEEDHTNHNLENVWRYGYTMKVVNSLDTMTEGLLESIQEALFYLKNHRLNVPIPVPNLDGKFLQRIPLSEETPGGQGDSEEGCDLLFAVHLLTFLPGKPLSSVHYSPGILRGLGETLARLIQAFQGFSSPVLEKRSTNWSLWSVPKLRSYTFAVKDPDRRTLVEGVIENFTNHVLPRFKDYPQGFIHGDLNEHNVLVDDEGLVVSGVLDLGDVQRAPRLFEVAVCLVYPMLGGEERLGPGADPLLAPGHVLAGLGRNLQLTEEEMELLKPCMEARLAQSVTMGAYTSQLAPGNDYVLDSSRHGWTVLQRLVDHDTGELIGKWKDIMSCKNSSEAQIKRSA